jgi:hypothetical protein
MSKHTPGKWEVYGSETSNAVWVKSANGRICTMKPCENDLSNARLIAAAPEMYEALKGLFEHCAMIHKHWGEGSNQKDANLAIAKAQSILTKIEGVEK